MKRVHIVGAGAAGLACATYLERAGDDLDITISEASDGVGGRVRSDTVDGHTLDRGFQIFLTSYPESRPLFDYRALRLGRFVPGARVRLGGRWDVAADPLRAPGYLLPTALTSLATPADKLALARLWTHVMRRTHDDLLHEPETSTLDYLRAFGLSDVVIGRFFRPFYGGVFLEQELTTSSRLFAFTFRCFAAGAATLPAGGIGRAMGQLAANLRRTDLRLNSPADRLPDADAVVVAADADAAAALLGEPAMRTAWHATTVHHYAADASPANGEPILMLGGESGGLVNNVTVPSDVADGYAPPGGHQVCVSLVGAHPGSEPEVRRELRAWFGGQADGWRHLRELVVEKALPDQAPPALADPEKPVRRDVGLYVCGDHRATASLNGVLGTGRRAAEAVLHDLRTGLI